MLSVLSKSLVFIVVAFSLLNMASCGDESSETTPEEMLDEVAPVINCPGDITISISAVEEEPIVTYDAPVGTDENEPITTQVEGLASGVAYPVGNTTNVFKVIDAAGNSTTCSFVVTIIREEPNGLDEPFVIGGNAPEGKKWVKVEELSDEFDGSTLDASKWHNNPATDPFGWYGRPPALFDPENVSVADGSLNVTVLEYESPKVTNGKSWSHGGAILRSKSKAGPGQFYEARVQANKTVMSTTFWIAFTQNCNTGPKRKLELDIQECVGRVHSGTQSWASEWDASYHSNAWRHARSCDVATSENWSGQMKIEEKNHSRYFVYGCWWKSPTEMLFYLDGEFVYRINPATDFDIEGHITMAIESYDWNPIDEDNILKTGSKEDRTTKYDWVRTWKLEDE